jgi:hypothetical protein
MPRKVTHSAATPKKIQPPAAKPAKANRAAAAPRAPADGFDARPATNTLAANAVRLPPVEPNGVDDGPFDVSSDQVAQMWRSVEGNPTATFGRDWSQDLQGAVQPGGKLTIHYDPNRAQVESSHDGFPSWNVEAYVQFQPSGQIVHGPALGFVSDQGTPTNNAVSVPFTVDVPKDATSVQVWFKNTSLNDGDPQVFWDSNFGRNFTIPVTSQN